MLAGPLPSLPAAQEGVQGRTAIPCRMEKKRRAGRAFARAKKVIIWTMALVFSYVDLVSTVNVGFQYLAIGDEGRDAAYMTFGMLAGSLAPAER